jgi:hypothetical protein
LTPKYFVRVEPCGFKEEDGNEFAGPAAAIKLATAVAGT